MACTTVTSLKSVSFPTAPCAELLVWRQSTSWIRTLLVAFVSCKQLQKFHSRESLFSVACVTILSCSGWALQNGFCPLNATILASLVGTMWCWQQNWFLRPPTIFALKLFFQLLLFLLDFALRLCVCMCKPSRMKVWTAPGGTGVVLKWSYQAGLRKGCYCWEELSCPLPAIFPAVPLCKQQCWGCCEVKPTQNAFQLPPAPFLLLISQCSAARAGAGPGEGVARSRSWSRRWQGGGTVADHRAALFSAAALSDWALCDCEW